MPETLNIECGSSTRKGLEMFSDMREKYEKLMHILKTTPDSEKFMFAVKAKKELEKEINGMPEEDKKLFDLGKQAFENIRNYGAPTWYEWSINNWDTKWNAYDFDYDKDKTIYAITSKKLTATFKGNGASVSSSSSSCNIYNTAKTCNVAAPTITRSGWTILGFSTNKNATTGSTAKTLSAGKTYYAITKKNIKVTFDSKGAETIEYKSKSCTIYNSQTKCKI